MQTQLIFLGAPGSGKGTQAKKLSADKKCVQISTGDLLRAEVAKGSELGNKINGIISKGSLVDDQTVADLLKLNCDVNNLSYIFDGFPRNVEQAKILDTQILKVVPSKAIYFEIDLAILKDRLINRRSCKKCGAIFNLKSHPPKVAGKCDLCQAGLVQRSDDREEVVDHRLNVFNDAITPLLGYYRDTKRLVTINATGTQEEVYKSLLGAATV